MRHIVVLALGLTAALLMVGQWLSPVHPLSGPTDAPVTSSAAPTPSAAAPARMAGDALELARDATGQFHLDAKVNGETVKFLVDTGADAVALTVADAERAGFRIDPDSFQPILRTASGEGWGTVVQIDRIELGRTELHNVGAVVVKDLGVSLLGQSVLARLGKVELKGDTMVLVPAD